MFDCKILLCTGAIFAATCLPSSSVAFDIGADVGFGGLGASADVDVDLGAGGSGAGANVDIGLGAGSGGAGASVDVGLGGGSGGAGANVDISLGGGGTQPGTTPGAPGSTAIAAAPGSVTATAAPSDTATAWPQISLLGKVLYSKDRRVLGLIDEIVRQDAKACTVRIELSRSSGLARDSVLMRLPMANYRGDTVRIGLTQAQFANRYAQSG